MKLTGVAMSAQIIGASQFRLAHNRHQRLFTQLQISRHASTRTRHLQIAFAWLGILQKLLKDCRSGLMQRGPQIHLDGFQVDPLCFFQAGKDPV
jgi:hypothetical protein